MLNDTGLMAVAHVIQLSVAPVFLLSGIGAMLSVMATRLARIVDRARVFEEELELAKPERAQALHARLRVLSHRARVISGGIALCTVTALLVCALIAMLFLGTFFQFDAAVPVALLFIGAMLAFFVGLLLFLREIYVATATLRIGSR